MSNGKPWSWCRFKIALAAAPVRYFGLGLTQCHPLFKRISAPASRVGNLLFIDDRPGKFLCRVDSTIAVDRHTRSSLAPPLYGNGKRPLLVINRGGDRSTFVIHCFNDICHSQNFTWVMPIYKSPEELLVPSKSGGSATLVFWATIMKQWKLRTSHVGSRKRIGESGS
jgi:hypothetical protein